MQLVFNQLQSGIQTGCLFLIPLFLLIKIGLLIIKGFISSNPIHYHSFYTGILLWILIATYPTVIQKTGAVCNFIIGFVSKPLDDPIHSVTIAMNEARALRLATYSKNLDQSTQKMKSGNLWQGLKNWTSSTWAAMISEVKSTGVDFLASLVSVFASIARAFIETVRALLLKFLLAIGPLALTLSLNEGFGHIGKFWFQKLVSVYLWSLTLNILDHIILDYYNQVSVMPALNQFIGQGQGSTETPYFMDQIMVGFMYTLVPWLTSLYMGGFNSSHFLTTNFRAFTTLVSSSLTTTNSLINRK